MAQIISEESYNKVVEETKVPKARVLTPEEYDAVIKQASNPSDDDITIGDYLRTVPATAVDITLGAGEGFASAIGEFTGDYDLARKIGAFREDVNDAIMGDTPDELQSDFAYKLSSGLGSTLPYLGAAILAKKPSLLAKSGVGAFFLSSAGQQVRDDYLATQGVTSEDASDDQMSESNKAGAVGAIPIALAERLGAGLILRPFAGGPIPAGKVMERITQYATAGAGEALTEATQSGLINSIAGYVRKYDEDRPITQGMAESALIGFLVGGGVNATMDTVQKKITQADRLKAGVANGDINAKDVIDPEIGSKLTEVAMESNAIPEADTRQQGRITDPAGWRNFVSKTLTPISRRLGRAGKEVVREFRKYEMDVGIKTKDLKGRILDFQQSIQKLKKTSPKDYEALTLALANANQFATSMPNSVERDLNKRQQIQPEMGFSQSEQLLNATNVDAGLINNQIEQARNAIEQRGLKTKIEIIEGGNSFYDPIANTIAISAEQADGTTVAHEFFHAVLGQSVKTDIELQDMTRGMFDSVIRASVDGSSLNTQLKSFISKYDENIQNEEFLAQTVGELARQYTTLDLNTQTRVKIWVNQVMQALGMGGVFKQAETDAEIIEQLNAFSRFSGNPDVLTNNVNPSFVKQMVDPSGEQAFLSQPIEASKFQLADFQALPKLKFTSKSKKYSRITEANKIDFASLVSKLKKEDARVTFWAADQFGSGTYKDMATGKSYDLDGGISFPFDKRGKRKKYAWASTSNESMRKMLGDADYVFLVSGKPDSQLLYNSQLHSILADRAKKQYGSIENAFTKILELAEAEGRSNKSLNTLARIRDKGADQYFTESSNTQLGNFLKEFKGQSELSADTEYTRAVESIMPNANELRDGFLKDNDFQFLDIMGVMQTTGEVGIGESGHGTYRDGVIGKFIGIPDVRVQAYDLFTDEAKAQFKDQMVKNAVNTRKQAFFDKEGVEANPEQVEQFKLEKENNAVQFFDKPTKYHSQWTGGTVGYKSRQASSFIDPLATQEEVFSPASSEQFREGAKSLRRYQKGRATDEERIRGLSDEGLGVLQRNGMVEQYVEVRKVLEELKGEYEALGLDMNYIDNYFPRLMKDLDGFRGSIGQTTGIDEEIRRYENMTGQKMTVVERQKMYEKLARSRMYRAGISQPANLKERRKDEVKQSELQYYADPEQALEEYVGRMVNTIETKKLIGDAQSGKTQGKDQISGRLGVVMDDLAKQGRLRQDQIDVVQGAVAARFGQHGSQYGFVKGLKNAGYLATMGNTGSTLTQLGDFYFTMVQNGLIPTLRAAVGSKALTVEDLGIAKDLVTVETKDSQGFLGKSVDNVFKLTGLTAIDRLAKNTNINAAYKVMQKGAKSNQNSRAYEKTLSRLKRTQGNDAYKTIADLKKGVKSDYVIEALYNELADVAPISLTEMPENYSNNPNLRILYSLKSYTIKQFNFVRERSFSKITEGVATGNPSKVAEGSVELMRILAFGALANGSADVLKAIMFNREIDEEDFWWNHLLRMFGITKYTTVKARKEGLGSAIRDSILPPQFSILDDIYRDVAKGASEDGIDANEMRSMKYMPIVGKLYYWREGKGVQIEEKLSRLRGKD